MSIDRSSLKGEARRFLNVLISFADPDQNPDPERSTSQRYGSGSFYYHAKIGSKKNLDSYYFVTLFDFLSLKMM